ncbi:MAG: alkaline phosphatase family protein [Candidatus Promineifilaceae bacterium]
MLTETHPKTLFVGLDAACWEYVTPLLEAGRLPALQRLMDGGIWGTLHSTLPALTPTAWASIVTGKNPGKHGVYDMLQHKPGTYDFRPTSSSARVGTPFWQRLNDRGIRVGLVNVPFTYPPDEIDGFVVCGFGAPESAEDVAAPADALNWIQAHVPDYASRGKLKDLRKTISLEELLAGEREHQSQQVRIATDLAHHYDVSVLVINLMLLDHINHYAQQFDQIEQAICDTDSDLAYLIENFQPDNVLLFSDHGSRRVQGDFLLHQWLLDGRYISLRERPPAEQKVALHTILVERSRLQQQSGWWEKVNRRLLQGAIQSLPPSMTGSLWQSIEKTLPFARQYVRQGEELDYNRTQLFPGSTYSGNFYVNLTGREPNGVVFPESLAALQAELAQKLSQLTGPGSSEPILSGVYTAEQLYHGPAAPYAPDLVLDGYNAIWNTKITSPGLVSSPVLADYFLAQHGDAGWHSKDGLFVFTGPAIRQGAADWDGRVMDLPATLLYQYDIPIPEDFDGRVLLDAFTADFRGQQPIQHQTGDPETALPFESGYSNDEAADVLEHLRSLGYVE